ncbi:MarR family winged helix-turn-helix transcriptional regulator [Paraferrimonas haliotis]|uniref:MarR family transcriptional regulator n=1 Tax=Paraferrimonas haliotis TaxID=2013866 RepID=A0AA37TS59_9GAMM|nr:MarR family winged helix-turn-helix transcriptional regulator [Paraferrimonas haliotis]GLS82134.1 MarR family transcriptional regulator [Paraferrimonas haliotis]
MSNRSFQLSRFLPYRLAQLSKLVSDDFSELYKASEGLTVAQWRLLANLSERYPLTAQDLVETAQLDKSKVSRALSGLLQRQLIVREKHPQDTRANMHRPTEQGLAMYARICQRAQDWEQQSLAHLSSQEYEQLLQLMDKVSKGIKQRDGII